MDTPRRIAVLVSGSGTNLQALMDACNTPRLPHAQIVLVFSNRKAAYGLVRAASADPPIPTGYLGLQPFLRAHPGATREVYDLAVAREVREVRPDVVVLAGWMHIVSEAFLEIMRGEALSPPPPPPQPGQQSEEQAPSSGVLQDEQGQGVGADEAERARSIPVINLHPALPGQFDGANAIERGFEAFQRGEVDKLGVMVHHVVAQVDRGAPILVREVDVCKGEDLKTDYEPRVHQTEWEVIVEATKSILDAIKPINDPH